MNLSRRGFLKVMGLATVAAYTNPELALNRIAFPDFVPGQQYRKAFAFPFPIQKLGLVKRKEFMNKLDDWMKTKVPPNFLDLGKVEYLYQNFDYDDEGSKPLWREPEEPEWDDSVFFISVAEREATIKEIERKGN